MELALSLTALIFAVPSLFIGIYVFIDLKLTKSAIGAHEPRDLPMRDKRIIWENIARGQGNERPSLDDGIIPGVTDDALDEDFSL